MATTDHDQSRLVTHDLPRAERILTLEFGSREDFENPSLEYRRLFSELLGTFMLVLVAAGGGLLHGKGEISLTAAVVAPGLMVMAIIIQTGRGAGARSRRCVNLVPVAGAVVSPTIAILGVVQPVQLVGVVIQPVGGRLSGVVVLAVVASRRLLFSALADDVQLLAGELYDLLQRLFKVHLSLSARWLDRLMAMT